MAGFLKRKTLDSKTEFFLSYSIIYVYFLPQYIFVQHDPAWYSWRSGHGIRSEIRGGDSWEPQYVFWVWNLGPQEEQTQLLTNEPCLLSLNSWKNDQNRDINMPLHFFSIFAETIQIISILQFRYKNYPRFIISNKQIYFL